MTTKSSYLTCSALILTAALSTATSCKSQQKPNAPTATTAVATTKVDTLVTSPAYTYTTHLDSTIECSFTVDYPQQSDSLAQGVKQFIVKQIEQNYVPRYDSDDRANAAKQYPYFTGSTEKAESLVKFYAEGIKRYFTQQQKDMMQEMEWTDEERPNFKCDLKIRKNAENSRYVTYSVANELYTGGAHGSYTFDRFNISKRTHRALTQTVDTTKVMAMQELLKQGVISYLKECGIENAEKNYKQELMLPEDGHIPLPQSTPCLVKDGVEFTYQQYEIACYAMGLVCFTIPYSQIKPYLCKEALELIE